MARPGIQLKDLDKGWRQLKDVVLKLSQRGGAYVLVGVQGREAEQVHPKGKLTLSALASIHEFGLGVPQRSFLRGTVDEYRGAIQQRAALLGRAVALGLLTTQIALELLGEYVVGLIKQRIADGIMPPLAESTIRRKGSSTPLIDGGHLRGAITHRIEVR